METVNAMLDMTKTFWYWAFRYVDNDEPAILVAMQQPGANSFNIYDLLRKYVLVDATRAINSAGISTEEWKTWHAFALCPAIEVYIDLGLKYREIAS